MSTIDGFDYPPMEFAFPGPLRDALVTAVLEGTKTSTTGVLADYEHEGEELPQVGERYTVLDSHGRGVGVVEVTEVRVLRLADVDWPHVRDEGEGDTSIAQWRANHESFWHGPEMRAAMGDPRLHRRRRHPGRHQTLQTPPAHGRRVTPRLWAELPIDVDWNPAELQPSLQKLHLRQRARHTVVAQFLDQLTGL